MSYGTVFYEKYLDVNNCDNHLSWLHTSGVSHIEFTAHNTLFATSSLIELVKSSHAQGTAISFHMPDFIDFSLFSLYGLSLPQNNHHTLSYFDILLEAATQKRTSFVLHGLNAENYRFVHGYLPSENQLKDMNLTALDRLLTLVEKRHLPIQLSFENTAPQDGLGYGQSPQTLLTLQREFKTQSFGFCIDLAHWWRASQVNDFDAVAIHDLLNQNLLEISHFHVHGFDDSMKTSHLSLKNGNDDFLSFVKAIHSKKLKKTFVLECFFDNEIPNLSTYESKLLQEFELF